MDSPSRPDWRRLLVLYWITSVVEGIGVAQIYAFMSTRLSEVGMSDADIGHVLGLLFSLFFVAGLPLIPLWGVWADKYSRKAVIIRSALVEAVVFVAVAASAAPWQLAVSMVLVGFQLGNSGVMIAAIRDVTPRPRLGLAMGIFASSTPLGFGLGPEVGQVMIGSLHYSSAAVFMVSAGLSVAVALMLALGSAEVRPEIVPTGSTLRLAFGAVRGVFADRTVRWLFAVSAIVFVGRQMALPYLPLVVHATEGSSLRAAGSVGTVLFVSAIFGAVLAPVSGWAADRIGFRRVLVVAVAGSAVSIWFLGAAPTVAWIAVAATLQTAFQAGVGSMVSGLLAVEVPSERRSATLNLIYLPLYIGGIAGPALGAGVVTVGLRTVFYVAALILAAGVVLAIAAISAVAAAFDGWLLAWSGAFRGHTVIRHMWGGVALAAVCMAAWSARKTASPSYRLWLAGAVVLMVWTGHEGGKLSHGDNYLTQFMPGRLRSWIGAAPPPRLPAAPEASAVSASSAYAVRIDPLFERSCVSCHGPDKMKGNNLQWSRE